MNVKVQVRHDQQPQGIFEYTNTFLKYVKCVTTLKFANSYMEWQKKKNHVNCAINMEIESYISEEKNLAES